MSRVKEATQEVWSFVWLEQLWQDFRFGVRVLAKNPGFTAVVAVTLALGIGVSTTVFSLLDAVFVPHLNVPDLDRIALLLASTREQGEMRFAVSTPEFADWRGQTQLFEDMALFSPSSLLLSDAGEPRRMSAMQVTDGFFRVAGVKPVLGRTFLPEECQSGADRVIILSHRAWRDTFGSDRGILGRTIRLNRQPYTVIGVMPEDFSFPLPRSETDLWVALSLNSIQRDRGRRFGQAIGRMKFGVTAKQAQAEMTTIAHQLEQAYPATDAGRSIKVVLLRDDFNKKLSQGIMFLGGAALFVLLIACANVANLLLARASGRVKEMGVRAALGAGRVRLIRLLLAESKVQALLGGALGVCLSYGGMALVRGLFSTVLDIPPGALRMNVRLLGFAALLSVLTPVLFGVVPAFYGTRLQIGETLKTGGIVGRAGTGSHRLREWLVVVEMLLAIVLVGMCGLFMSISRWLAHGVPGFDPNNLVTVTITTPPDPGAVQAGTFHRQILQHLSAVQGVSAVGLVDRLPMDIDDRNASRRVVIEPSTLTSVLAADLTVSPGYFATMQIPVLRGRDVSWGDSSRHDSAAWVSETMARRCWPNEDPIGKRFWLGTQEAQKTPMIVVGVVGDVLNGNHARPPLSLVYRPLNEIPDQSLAAVVRAAPYSISLMPALKRAIWEVDKDQILDDLRTMKEALYGTSEEYARAVGTSGAFAGLALTLAAIGVYSVMSYFVSERTAELGIRIALGATPRDVLRLVVGKGLTLALSGGIVGLAGTWALERITLNQVTGLTSSMNITAAYVASVLVFVALVACYIPARRATKVDPMVALRYE